MTEDTEDMEAVKVERQQHGWTIRTPDGQEVWRSTLGMAQRYVRTWVTKHPWAEAVPIDVRMHDGFWVRFTREAMESTTPSRIVGRITSEGLMRISTSTTTSNTNRGDDNL